MDNQKTIQIVMMALLIISTTMGILTYIALMSMSGGVSFNPSSAYTGDLTQEKIDGPGVLFNEYLQRIDLVNNGNEFTNDVVTKDQCDRMCAQTFGCTDGKNDPDPDNKNLANCIHSICDDPEVRGKLSGNRNNDGAIFRQACKREKQQIQE